jgi:MoaA/NifB/PqqE/SkfB family radical SAM enzyme
MRRYTKEIFRKFIPNAILSYRANLLAKKKLYRLKLLKFEIHIADHCNLNCKSCSHFSPLVNEKFLDIDMFRRDCEKLAELTNGKIECIRFLGGEPLLHKDLISFFDVARQYFKKTDSYIVTNGILLLKQNVEFWKSCKANNIYICISNYSVKINRNEISRLARLHGVKIVYIEEAKAKWWGMKLDFNGQQNADENFRLCSQSNRCINLYEGKFYTCPAIAYIHHFNTYFNQHLSVTNDDYIDIYKVKNLDEILDFLCKTPPFCKYCTIKEQKKLEWGISKREISEWT